MTTIETDNPLIKLWAWGWDITWQYWYIWLVVLIVSMWLIARHFDRKDRDFE